MNSIAAKVGCTAETLRKWVRQDERDQGRRAGTTSDERARIEDGQIVEFLVTLQVIFLLEEHETDGAGSGPSGD